MKPNEQTRKYVALSLVDHLGAVTYKRLVEAFGDVEAIFKAKSKDILRFKGQSKIDPAQIKDAWIFRKADKEIETAVKHGIGIISIEESGYPPILRQIYDPPFVMYVKGRLPQPSLSWIAVIGSRVCSSYGRRMTHVISRDLSMAGVVVVSGMARGIDSAAHEGALEGPGKTVAVLGGGLLHIYPRENSKLASRIAERGAVLSEYPPNYRPRPENFPMRNRLISGLSRGVLVVEARKDSGAFITVDCALEQGREVYAVPGNIDSDKSCGTHLLIKQGAHLVTGAEDILKDLSMTAGGSAGKNRIMEPIDLSPDEKKIMSYFESDPLSFDDLVELTSLSASKTASVLSLLTLKKVLKELPGKYYDVHENYVTLSSGGK